MDWNNGYMVDTEYSAGFFAVQAPQHLDACLVLAGIEPVAPTGPFTYCDLGCGHGLTVAALAAANPAARFYAADFMPSHISAANRLVAGTGLDNLVLLEKSFEELARGDVDLPAFDYITMHGVYTWVPPECRRQIVDFVARYLKPGGVVYVSYNALPGWAVVHPLQRLVLEHTNRMPGDSRVHVEAARAFIDRMSQLGARYLSDNDAPVLAERLNGWKTRSAPYLAHEYLNQSFEPLYFADVARGFAPAKLDYATSAIPLMTMFRGSMTAPERALLDDIADAEFRETVADYMRNVSFRCDVYVRGARRLSPLARREWLGRVSLALTVSLPLVTLISIERLPAVDTPAQRAALEALSEAPRTLAELIALPGQSEASVLTLAATLLFQQQGALYVLPASDNQVSFDRAGRLNRSIAESARHSDAYQAFAAPVIGSGLRVSRLQRLVYRAVARQQGTIDAAAVLREVQADLAAMQSANPTNVAEAGTPQGELADAVGLALHHCVPTWKRLGAL
jgi:SAM-dependent methyltransferase